MSAVLEIVKEVKATQRAKVRALAERIHRGEKPSADEIVGIDAARLETEVEALKWRRRITDQQHISRAADRRVQELRAKVNAVASQRNQLNAEYVAADGKLFAQIVELRPEITAAEDASRTESRQLTALEDYLIRLERKLAAD